jgi:phage-related protein
MARTKRALGEKPLLWIGSARSDLLKFPAAVKDQIGIALSAAQFGDTYRAVYTVRFEKAAYVLHTFQKKSRAALRRHRPTWNWFLEDSR